MLKVWISFVCILSSVFSQTIQFQEEKYYDALGKTFQKRGKILFAGEKIQIVYDDNTTVTYTGDYLYTQKNAKTKRIDLAGKPAVKMFFILFESIYLNKKVLLEEYFNTSKSGTISLLKPKARMSRYISTVRYKKIKTKLDFLEIKLTNKDWIRIEERD